MQQKWSSHKQQHAGHGIFCKDIQYTMSTVEDCQAYHSWWIHGDTCIHAQEHLKLWVSTFLTCKSLWGHLRADSGSERRPIGEERTHGSNSVVRGLTVPWNFLPTFSSPFPSLQQAIAALQLLLRPDSSTPHLLLPQRTHIHRCNLCLRHAQLTICPVLHFGTL